jgi:hypothetical protein
MTNYDDDTQLFKYVYNCYGNQFTTTYESTILSCFSKPSRQNESLARNGYSIDDPRIQATLKEGHEAFKGRIARRILAEHADEIVIVRCERCSRIVSTPKARQCLWCGYDWH